MEGAERSSAPFLMRALLALVLLLSLAAACNGGGGDDDDDVVTPVPSAARITVTGPIDVVEEIPASYVVQVVTTAGEPTTWSGTVSVSSITGPVTPTAVVVSNGQGAGAFTLEFSASGVSHGLVFSAPGLPSFTRYLNVSAIVPSKVAGAGVGESVFGPSANGWDRDGVWSPSVWEQGAELRMLYASSATNGAPQIGLAISNDEGLTWTRGASPVIGPAVSATACHQDGAQNPSVFRRADGTLGVLYQGKTAARLHLCLAVSSDGGSTWTPVGGPAEDGAVLATSATPFESTEVRNAAVVLTTGSQLAALYTGKGTDEVDATNAGPETIVGIGLAFSSDGGVTWTKHEGDYSGALLAVYYEAPNGSTWDAYELTDPSIEKDDTVYRVFLGGLATGGYRIGLYEALDLTDFPGHVDNLLSDPYHDMIGHGPMGRFDEDGARFPSVLSIGGVRTIFYTGIAGDGVSRIGLARCDPSPFSDRSPVFIESAR